MTENSDILLEKLSQHLKATRQKLGLSLDTVAQLSGISRSMVSQVERSESSPTIATLWKLTRALRLDLGDLLGEPDRPHSITVVRQEDTPIIEDRGPGCTIRVLSTPKQNGRHEAFELLFSWGGELDSLPHAPGTIEHLTVIDGKLDVQSGGAVQELQAGDTARYRADVPHSITAKGKARAFLIVDV